MEKDDHIFNIFKDNQHKLEEMPSSNAWDKLEEKLDDRHQTQRRFFYKQTGIAAAVVLLIGFVASLSIFKPQSNIALAEKAVPENVQTALESDAIAVRSANDPLIMTHFERERIIATKKNNKPVVKDLKPQIANRIDQNNINIEKQIAEVIKEEYKSEEVKPSMNLSSKEKSFVEESVEEELEKGSNEDGVIAPPAPAKPNIGISDDRIFTEPGATAGYTTLSDSLTTLTKEELVNTESAKERLDVMNESKNGYNGNIATIEFKKDEEARNNDLLRQRQEEMIREHKLKRNDKNNTAKSAKKEANKYAEGTSVSPVAPSIIADEIMVSEIMEEEVIPLDITMTNSVQYESKDKSSAQASIQQFEWILGEWATNDQKSFEQWERTDNLTIEGKGFLVINGDTLFTEGMKIRQIGDALYFIVAVDESNKENHYVLKSYNDRQAVFENESLQFPNQVVIERNSNNNFTTIMQNNNSSNITESQNLFFNQRNQVVNEKAYRSLNRKN